MVSTDSTPSEIPDFKAYFNAQPLHKRFLWIGAVTLAPILFLSVLAYAFTFHGMLALYHWVAIAKFLVILIIIFSISIPIFAVLDIIFAKKIFQAKKARKPAKTHQFNLPSKFIWTIALIGIIVPVSLYSWAKLSMMIRTGNTPPQLMIADGTGDYGIANLAVVFWTEEPTQNTLTYGYDSISRELKENKAAQTHAFMLNNLMPDKTYWYRLNDQEKTYQFKTPTNITNQLKFAVSSDCHLGAPSASEEMTVQILKTITDPTRSNDYFFFLGDFIEYGFEDASWKKGIDVFHPYTSVFPTAALIGNHDAMFAGANFFQDYFYPATMEYDTGNSFYRRTDINGIHILQLDMEWGTIENFDEAQEKWLIEQLESIPKDDWTIVMTHTYYYASGTYAGGTAWYDNPETIETLVPLFEKYGVDLVFSGHIHAMEHLTLKGISYTVVGTFGGHLEPEKDVNSVAESHFYDRSNYGFVEVDINGNSAYIGYYDENGKLLYEYTHTK
jgi:predicted MPP superfamily phosphohydrolase